jgi:hypothetical protein
MTDTSENTQSEDTTMEDTDVQDTDVTREDQNEFAPTDAPVDVPVDIAQLSSEQRLAVLEQLLTAQREQRAKDKAMRAERRHARDNGQSERVERDAQMLTDIGTKLLALEQTKTTCDPRGFRRYTGTVVIDGVELRITATAHEARKRGRPRREDQASENGAQAEAPEDDVQEESTQEDDFDYAVDADYAADNV